LPGASLANRGALSSFRHANTTAFCRFISSELISPAPRSRFSKKSFPVPARHFPDFSFQTPPFSFFIPGQLGPDALCRRSFILPVTRRARLASIVRGQILFFLGEFALFFRVSSRIF